MNAKSSKKTGTKTKGTLAKTQAKVATTPAGGNPLLTARGPEFTDALNAATVKQLEEAFKHHGMSNQQRNRIELALKLRTSPVPAAKVAEAIADGQKAAAENVEAATPAKKAGKAKTPKAAKPEGKMSGLDAAAKVLAESPTPLNAKAIVEAMKAKGYWSSTAATPHATIYSGMLTEIVKKGDQARFVKANRGLFTVTAAGKHAK